MKSISGLNWGAHPSNLLAVYRSWVRPILEYGSQAFCDINPNVSIILDRLQFEALRVTLGVMSTTPTNSLLHLSGEAPLHLRRFFILRSYLVRCFSITDHPVRQLAESLYFRNLNLTSCVSMPFFQAIHSTFVEVRHSLYVSHLPVSLSFHFLTGALRLPMVAAISGVRARGSSYQVTNLFSCEDSRAVRSLSMEQRFREDLSTLGLLEYHLVYTDGSKSDAGVGCAAFSHSSSISLSFKLSDDISIFEAEAFAIMHALVAVFERGIKKCIIASDSKSVLEAIASPDLSGRHHPAVYLIKDLFTSLRDAGNQTLFMWIPGHCGILGNEVVDQMAKNASLNLYTTGSHEEIKFSTSFRRIFENDLRTDSIEFFKHSSITRGFRYFHRTRIKSTTPWFSEFESLDRFTIALISRIRTSHVLLGEHLFDKHITDSPLCECGTAESLNHVFFECPLHSDESDRLRIGLARAGLGWPIDVVDIAFSDNESAFAELAIFVKRIKRRL